LNEDVNAEALKGLEEFSHIEVIYIFHKAIRSTVVMKSEHPRENFLAASIARHNFFNTF